MVKHGIWVLNPGSSSIKCTWFEFIDSAQPSLHEQKDVAEVPEFAQWLQKIRPAEVFIVRLVHGGPDFFSPLLITDENLEVLENFRGLAPLHNGNSIDLLRALLTASIRATVLAVFDSGFFHTLPERASRYGLPEGLTKKYGIRRFGFHGFAHEAMLTSWHRRTGNRLQPARLVTIQLGSGCSMAAILDGKPIDTTMGFTPNEGLLMSTRCGDIDPGLVTWLQRREHWTPEETDKILNEDSGWSGVSGISSNFGELLDSPEPSARRAIEIFSYRIRKTLGAYYAILGGLDGVTMSGGIAEHSVPFCTDLLRGLEHLGIFPGKREDYPDLIQHDEYLQISAPDSPVRCEIIRNNEPQAMLQSVLQSQILAPGSGTHEVR